MTEKESLLNTLLSLSMIVEARDPYTGGHLWRVSQFSKLLAEAAGLSRRDVVLCEIGGFLHDLGKVGVPDAILNKPDKLSDNEFSIIRTHPSVGSRLLATHPLADLAMDAVVGHHERPDGKGYPNGIAGEVIPRVARIVSIADAFDAMTSTRAYRKGMPIETAIRIIDNEAGKQFDRVLAKTFIALQSTAYLNHIVGHSEPGLPLHWCPCGAPVVLRSAQHNGDFVYCRNCGGEARILKNGGEARIELTGGHGDPVTLAPDSDQDLLAGMVSNIAPLVI